MYIYIYICVCVCVCVCMLNVHYMHMLKSTHCPHPPIGSAIMTLLKPIHKIDAVKFVVCMDICMCVYLYAHYIYIYIYYLTNSIRNVSVATDEGPKLAPSEGTSRRNIES